MFDRELLSLPGMRGSFILCVVTSVLRAMLAIAQCFSLAWAIVSLWEGMGLARVAGAVATFAACFIARHLVKVFEEWRMDMVSERLASHMAGELADAIWDRGPSLTAATGTAPLSSMLVEGIPSISSYARTVIPKTVGVIAIPFLIAIATYTQDWVSGLIVTVCYPFIIIFMRLIGHTASDESAKRLKGFSVMSGSFLDSLRGMSTLKAFGVSKAFSDNVYKASEAYRRTVMKTLRIATLSSTVLDIFATCGLAAVAIMLGFRMVDGDMAFLPALTVLMLVPEFFMPIKAYASDYHATLEGRSSLESLLAMIRMPNRTVDVPAGDVVIPMGGKVALVGKTGSGKSTLLSMIAGMIRPGEGYLEVAGTVPSGDPEWQDRIAYIPQRPHVLDSSLKDNVTLYKPDASDREVVSALEQAGLSALLEELTDGIYTELGRNGRALSSGQAQRLSIARALIDPSRDIWLLDEPGSNLDLWTERELKASVLEAAEARTVIIATHRLHWVDDLDDVIDLDEVA